MPDNAVPPDPFAAVAGLEGVPSAVRAARDAVDAVLRDRGHRPVGPEVTSESLLRGAIASARLEGSASDDATVRAGGGDPIARAAVHLSTELLGVLPAWQSAPLQALARLHAIAAAGTLDDADRGRPVVAAGADASHNGLVARAAERLTLIATGVDRASVTVPEMGHLALGADTYRSTLEGYRTRGRDGMHGWVLQAIRAYSSGAEAAVDLIR